MGQRGAKWRHEGGCFVTGTMNLLFFVTGQIGMKFGRKSKRLFNVILPPKPPFWGCFEWTPCYRPSGQALHFSTSITGRANGVRTSNRLFVRLTVSAVEAPKVTQISIS